MLRAVAIADESVESIIRSNCRAEQVDCEWWYDSSDADGDAASAVEEALLYARQRGILRRLAESPALVRVVLVEPAYASDGGGA